MASIARAAQAAGHEVALLTSGGMADAISADLPGVDILAAGPMPDVLLAEVARRMGGDPESDPTPESVSELFAGTRVDFTIADALEQANRWSPDVIVAEACDFVGPLVAATLHIPWNLLAFGPAVPEEFTAPMFGVVASRYAERGLTPTPPRYYIDPCPGLLQVTGWQSPAQHLAIRPEAHRRPGASWQAPSFPTADHRTRVLITLGTVFTDPELLEQVIRSLHLHELEIVATVAGGPRPTDTDSIRYVSFAPMEDLLQGVDIVISAGGAGTVLATLSHGIPMVLLPQGADQPINAARAAAAGTALVVQDVSTVGAAVTALVRDQTYAKAAQRVASQIAEMPDACTVVDAITARDEAGLLGATVST
jgi:UDP:flavonoid glycosyltransferase YjiC (YdhE family)